MSDRPKFTQHVSDRQDLNLDVRDSYHWICDRMGLVRLIVKTFKNILMSK